MQRGLNNNFYYVLQDEGVACDSLQMLTFTVKKDDYKITFSDETIPAPYTGKILTFELNPLLTNDVSSVYHENLEMNEWQD